MKIIWLIASSKIGAVETAIPREVPQEFANYGEQVIPLREEACEKLDAERRILAGSRGIGASRMGIWSGYLAIGEELSFLPR